MRHRGLIEKLDRQRGEWWLCRKDSDPRGKWTITADPGPQWDWRFKVGFSYERAVRRLLVAQDEEKRTSKLAIKTAERVKQISLLADKMRLKRT
jgi:hypothetical protein